jgi:hypothetical protein
LEREFDELKWLKMHPKRDSECEKRDDIGLLFEMIANSIYWQQIWSWNCIIFRVNFKAYQSIRRDTEFLNPSLAWTNLPGNVLTIVLSEQINLIIVGWALMTETRRGSMDGKPS